MLLPLRQVFINGKQTSLTRQDYDLLHLFINNCGDALSYEQLYEQIWNAEYDESANTVIKNAIKRLRKKLCGDERDTSYIENVWGYGYEFKEQFAH